LNDPVGGANLYGGENYSFTYDRFCSVNEAIYFNKGYLQVPPGVYFSGDFTVTAWICLKSYQSYSRIFEFGNGPYDNNVILTMYESMSKIQACIVEGYSAHAPGFLTFSLVNLNQWYFVSFVLNGTTGHIYVNGSQVESGTLLIPNNITRISNFFGKSNNRDQNADAVYDEIKIYQGVLTSAEIMAEYKNNSNNGKK